MTDTNTPTQGMETYSDECLKELTELERKHGIELVSMEHHEATIARYERELAAREHDIDAYRGALGYTVRGDHDGRLSDGSTPNNGIAEALHQQLAARDAELARDRETLIYLNSRVDALRERAERAEADRDLWKEAVLEGCIVRCIYCAAHDTDPCKALNDCAVWDQQIALDPSVSKEARELRDTYKAERDAAVKDAERWYGHAGAMRVWVGSQSWKVDEETTREAGLTLVALFDAAIDAARGGK